MTMLIDREMQRELRRDAERDAARAEALAQRTEAETAAQAELRRYILERAISAVESAEATQQAAWHGEAIMPLRARLGDLDGAYARYTRTIKNARPGDDWQAVAEATVMLPIVERELPAARADVARLDESAALRWRTALVAVDEAEARAAKVRREATAKLDRHSLAAGTVADSPFQQELRALRARLAPTAYQSQHRTAE